MYRLKENIMKLKLYSLPLILSAASLLIISFNVLAAYSGYVGAGGSGGPASYSKTCPSGKRMTGFKVKHGDVIDKLRIRCTKLNKTNGQWVPSTHSWTSYTRSDAPLPARRVKSAYCPTNKWVHGVNATKINNVIQKLAVQCLPLNVNGQLVGTSIVKSAGANATGQWSRWKACPGKGMANGISGKSGWHLDKLRLRCVNSQSNVASSTSSNSNGSSSSSQNSSTTLARPQLFFPRWGSNSESYAMAGSWQLTVSKVNGATKYEVCLRDVGSSNCYLRKKITGSQSGNRVSLPITIPANKQGKTARWLARACNNQNQCGAWSGMEKFTIVPKTANLTSPSNNVTVNSRALQLRWSRQNYATSGFQVYIYKRGTRPYDWYQPTKQSNSNFYNYRVNSATSTSANITVPNSLGNNLSWIVVACAEYAGKGRRCSLGGRSHNVTIASSSAPSNNNARFSQILKSTFQSDRCVQCHGGKNLTNHNPGSSCKSCHSQSNTYKTGGLNVDWHAAPSSMNFVNKSSSYLCNKAKQPPASASASACGSSNPAERVRCHLTKDPLVLWAVDSGRLPNGRSVTKATPGNKNNWKQKVNQWIDGGMNCN